MLNTRSARADTEPIQILSDVALSSSQYWHQLMRTQSRYTELELPPTRADTESVLAPTR